MGDGTANPYASRPQPPAHSQSRPKQSREAYSELSKSDDDEGDDTSPFPILHGLPEHARVQLKLPREQDFAKESLLRAQQQGKKSQHDVRPVSDMSVYYEQAGGGRICCSSTESERVRKDSRRRAKTMWGRVGETIELSEIPRIVLNDIVVEEHQQHIGRAS